MKITRRQLRRIICEALPSHLQKHFRKDGSSIHEPEWEDVTPDGYGPDNMPKLKLADLVRAVDYEGDGRGGDFKPIVGKQIGTVIEIDEDPDYPTQYTVLFPDGTTIMDDLGPPGEERFELINEGNSTDPRGLKALLASLNVKGRDFGPVANSLALAYYDSEGSPQDMKDEVEHHSGGLPTSTDGEWIDWPIETYQEIWNLYKKAERSYKSPQSRGPRF